MTAPARYQPLATQQPHARTDISQTTAVEQSRAVAEVQAAVLVAQQRPRDKIAALAEMRDATAQQSVAERAYFRFHRAGEQVTGPTIHLARELARCWGNIDYGIKEMRRDDTAGISEMLAHAWDMETNARSSTTFIVPHVRDTRQGARKLTETRDIYENNANAGARRLREMIFNVLPSWFVEEAKGNCDQTLETGGGSPLAQRIGNTLRAFEDDLGVTRAQIEAKLGRSPDNWTGHDIGQLRVIYQSIKRGESSRDDEFPPAGSTIDADAIRAARGSADTSSTPDDAEGAAADSADEPQATSAELAPDQELGAPEPAPEGAPAAGASPDEPADAGGEQQVEQQQQVSASDPVPKPEPAGEPAAATGRTLIQTGQNKKLWTHLKDAGVTTTKDGLSWINERLAGEEPIKATKELTVDEYERLLIMLADEAAERRNTTDGGEGQGDLYIQPQGDQ